MRQDVQAAMAIAKHATGAQIPNQKIIEKAAVSFDLVLSPKAGDGTEGRD